MQFGLWLQNSSDQGLSDGVKVRLNVSSLLGWLAGNLLIMTPTGWLPPETPLQQGFTLFSEYPSPNLERSPRRPGHSSLFPSYDP